MSEKHKCSVCGFESERYEDFISESGGNWQDKTSNLLKTVFGTSSISICWVCFFKAFGVKPKEKSIVIGTIYTASNEVIHANVEVNGIPLNPCDALTRQHAAEIENEESLKKSCGYEPTLIPGCPAEIEKKAMEKKKADEKPYFNYNVISREVFIKENFEWEFPSTSPLIVKGLKMMSTDFIGGAKEILKGLGLEGDILNTAWSIDDAKQTYTVRGTRTYKKESS
jgi:hypothetical protein